MISVTINADRKQRGNEQYHTMREWLLEHVGLGAGSRHFISEIFRWTEDGTTIDFVFYFFDENDATMFKLAWS